MYVPSFETADEERAVAVIRAPGHACETLPLLPGTETLQLSHGQNVEGMVLDLAGRPLAGARVSSPAEPPFALST